MDISFITSTDWTALWGAITTVTTFIGGIIAWIKNKAAKTATENYETTQAFFDPDNTEVMTPTADTPENSWKMSDATKNYILASVPTDADKVDVLKQIEAAETAGYVDYKITFSTGYYAITYGLINGGGNTSAAESAVETVSTVEETSKVTTTSICPIPQGNDAYVSGTRMWKSTFEFAVCDEPTQEAKDYVKSEMQRLDPLNTYPYTISTDKNIYSVHLSKDTYGNDRTAEFGTNVDIIAKHK